MDGHPDEEVPSLATPDNATIAYRSSQPREASVAGSANNNETDDDDEGSFHDARQSLDPSSSEEGEDINNVGGDGITGRNDNDDNDDGVGRSIIVGTGRSSATGDEASELAAASSEVDIVSLILRLSHTTAPPADDAPEEEEPVAGHQEGARDATTGGVAALSEEETAEDVGQDDGGAERSDQLRRRRGAEEEERLDGMNEEAAEEDDGGGREDDGGGRVLTAAEAPAREHPYLPGTSHPLFPESLLEARKGKRSGSLGEGAGGDGPKKKWKKERKRKSRKRERDPSSASCSVGGRGDDNEDAAAVDGDGGTLGVEDGVEDHIDEGESSPTSSSSSFSSLSDTISNKNTTANHPPSTILSAPTAAPTIIHELPILELHAVVLFPNSTLPLRLQNPSWINYLGRKIDDSRGLNFFGKGEKVQIGIVTRISENQRRMRQERNPREARRRALDARRRALIRVERRRALPGRLHRGTSQGGSDNGGDRQRQQEAEESEEERSVVPRQTDVEAERRRQNPGGNDDEAAVLQWRQQRLRGQSRQQQQHDSLSSRPTPQQRSLDPLVGRIGTIATITYTHEEEEGTANTTGTTVDVDEDENNDAPQRSSSSRVWQRQHGRRQLVITALGTGRFRILSHMDDYGEIRLYTVENLPDENLPLPPSSICRLRGSLAEPTAGDNNGEMTEEEEEGFARAKSDGVARHTKDEEDEEAFDSVLALKRHEKIVKNLSIVSPIPAFAYNQVWPWRLVEMIRTTVDDIPGWEGMKRSLPRRRRQRQVVHSAAHDEKEDGIKVSPSTDGDDGGAANGGGAALDPIAFSFWMASNMPLTEEERLELLEMRCTVQRLRFVHDKLLQHKEDEKGVYCKRCGSEVAKVGNMFTVGGAEGTTGAYVNEYGVIHQTITLRTVNEDKVVYSGGPETKDSWFPGYSWTIAYCTVCHLHLGWKFLMVRRRGGRSDDRSGGNELLGGLAGRNQSSRPEQFWGLSGSSVTTDTDWSERMQRGRSLVAWFLRASNELTDI